MKRYLIRWTVFLLCLFLYLYGTTNTFQTGYPPVGSPFLSLVRLFGGTLTLSAVIVSLPLSFVLLFRKRFFCRYLCPLGFTFWLISWLKTTFVPQKYRLTESGTMVLSRFPWIGLLIIILVCGGAFVQFPMITRFLMLDPLVLFGGLFSAFTLPFYLLLSLFLLAFFAPWFWCGTFCPLGALQEIFHRLGCQIKRYGKYQKKLSEKQIVKNLPVNGEEVNIKRNPQEPQLASNRPRFCWSFLFGSRKTFRKAGTDSKPPKRRKFLMAGACTLASMVFFAPLTTIRVLFQNRLLPPGARNEPEFSTLCSSCGRCILACPTKHLVSLYQEVVYNENGEEKKPKVSSSSSLVLLPSVETQTSWCEKNCIACGQVCPTGAIRPFNLEEKKDLKVGLADYSFEHCVLYKEKDCNICIRECPWNALDLIWSEEYSINIPQVDAQKCTGCGRCVVVCPGFDPIWHGEEDEATFQEPPKAFTIKNINGD